MEKIPTIQLLEPLEYEQLLEYRRRVIEGLIKQYNDLFIGMHDKDMSIEKLKQDIRALEEQLQSLTDQITKLEKELRKCAETHWEEDNDRT